MMSTNKFMKGAMILAFAGIIVKVLGAIFRIPLTNKIGDGMAYYNAAYTIYSVFLVLSTAGIPVAISKMVSERIAIYNYKGAHRVFLVALVLLASMGLVAFLVCYVGAGEISNFIGIPEAALSLKSIAPAIFIVPIFSAFRGYFQGMQNMKPTAISEIMEQSIRVATGLLLAFALFPKGARYSAAGATFGASAGSIAGLASIFTIYCFNKRAINLNIQNGNNEVEDVKTILKKIAIIAVPIICGAEIMPIMTTIDTSIIVTRLQATGWTHNEATSLYSLYEAYCNTLISFPQIFTQAVAVSIVPVVAALYRRNKFEEMRENIKTGMRITMIMAFPCMIGMFVLSKAILLMLYPYQMEDAISAAPLLRIMTIGIVLLAIAQTATGILQSIGKQMIPVKNLAIGAIVKLFATYSFVGVTSINVKGAAIGTLVAYLIALVLDLMAIKKYTDISFDLVDTFIKPFAVSITMGICTYIIHLTLNVFVGNSLSTTISILAGILVYIFVAIKSNTLTRGDLELIPGGKFLLRIVNLG
ncbi:putative polysaccharide biosynthesis protein [Hornefia butyriciproducens]|uniref:Polysaccharide biosynthesis protein n=1 Tax=Hornefia butyriciproducens TaxID=2652293 RepID=A0A6L5Y741_9FIRM|nr:polysaccharide biosynthesis protein [Hornefia butyriciproducens]MST52401.1 polysaccharide biosynthesis protein [Hornefia butyriciproducens]